MDKKIHNKTKKKHVKIRQRDLVKWTNKYRIV